ncbi:hypothetical protein GCM10011378_12630 [Hymenobacter glacieicola]|uniref:Uncharacterized protein n=2 Tax=Hymenobacter glacieicola TaxID=1562124 RepID=A0ABQ1WR71_9BACT|nr:hypothetical protein GCM10011378_12630 [Hymenobacter glacieicola]
MLDGSTCGGTSALTVLLGENNQVYYYPGLDTDVVRKTDFSSAGLRRILQSYQSEYGLVVLLKPSDEATYQNMVDALDELQITNTKRYALVDLNQKDEELLRHSRL